MTEMKTKSDKTRTQIIEGALRALAQTGVLGTTTRKIAAEAGVQLATLHYQFESKGTLLVAVLEALIEEMTLALRKQVKTRSSLDDCIEQLLHGAWRAVMQTKPIQLVHYELTLYALREGLQWLAEQQYEAYAQLYRDYILGVSEGTHRLSPVACTAVARFMVAGIDGLILQELAKPNAARSKRGVDALIAASQAYARQLMEGTGA
jgi:AcrR family transcriptional regulator